MSVFDFCFDIELYLLYMVLNKKIHIPIVQARQTLQIALDHAYSQALSILSGY